MKNLNEYINESLSTRDERDLKKLGFKQYNEGEEVWFEAKIKGKLIRITQEEVGKDDWWNVRIESDYLMDADKKPMTFKTPLEAAKEVLEEIK